MNRSVPDNELLLKQLNNANRRSEAFILIAAMGAVVLFFAIDWAYLAQKWWYALIAVGLATSDSLKDYAMLVAKKKKRVSDLPEDTRIGLYSKSQLMQTVNSARLRLQLPQNDSTVFIVRDKSANASAVRVGLGGLLRSLNAVYINRAFVHILAPRELEAILCHEFAHNGPMRMSIRRYAPVLQIIIVMVALYVLQLMNFHAYWSLLAVLATIYPLHWAIAAYESRYSQIVEYLCDHAGARLVGSDAMINALLKTGSQAEAHLQIQWRLLRQGRSQDELSPKDLMQIFEDAVPFGTVDPDAVAIHINELRQSRLKDKQKLSVKGFLDYINGDPPDEVEEVMDELDQSIRKLNDRPVIDWTARFLPPKAESLSHPQIADLVQALDLQPDALLFRLPDEASGAGSSHPSFRNRVRTIFYNRLQ